MTHVNTLSRRFSFGGYQADLTDVSVWKFDALVGLAEVGSAQRTCYVKRATRGDSFVALFARCPGATVFGTGLPLTEEVARAEVGRSLSDGEVLLVDDVVGSASGSANNH